MRRLKPRRPGPGPAKRFRTDDGVAVADVVDRDPDGDLFVRSTKSGPDTLAIRLAPGQGEIAAGAPGLGDRLLVRIETAENGERQARMIKRLGQSAHHVLGVVRRSRQETRIETVDRRSRRGLILREAQARDLSDGDLVLVQPDLAGNGRRHTHELGRVIARLGREDDPRSASVIAAYVNGIPQGFSREALEGAANARQAPRAGRADLRDLPLVTIDPPDARDHDDAVFAEPDKSEKNPGGWTVWVAIADVAAFVTPGSGLDRDARDKGNSVYFPDRVEPMLPEALSAGLCSLIEGEDRACIAVRMTFDALGRKRAHVFSRGLMRSAASLTYAQAQAAFEGNSGSIANPALAEGLSCLWGAYLAISLARRARSPLEIISPERQVELDGEGKVVGVRPRVSLDANRLIEEFMIQANVCAAETLEKHRSPAIYRVHEAPSADKLRALKDFLETLGIPWSGGEPARTERFNRLLDSTREGPHAEIVNEVVLRTQMQAFYSTDNVGHFGLNLDRYAHFTSPIRRYADLIVHRSLIKALGLGDDCLSAADVARLEDTAEHISMTERRAMAAERESVDRYVASFLVDHVGAKFDGVITGVTRFGLFVRLKESGADGLIPISSLGQEYFVHDPKSHSLIGERTGARWRLGADVEVRLREATPVSGGLLFEMLTDPEPASGREAPRSLKTRPPSWRRARRS